MSATSLNIARRLLARGLSVIPIPRPAPGCDGKTAELPWKEFQSRLPTTDELEQWFDVETNLAIVCGAVSGIVAVDVDNADARSWWMWHRPYTPWQTITAKGNHFFYLHPGSRIPNRARLETPAGPLAIDVRGDGGYVIGPGSLHASGSTYRASGDWRQPKASLPVFDPTWIERPLTNTEDIDPCPQEFLIRNASKPFLARNAARSEFPASNSAVDVHIRARAYLDAIPKPEIGQGSDRAVFVAACRLVRSTAQSGAAFGVSASEAEQLLWEWCGNRPGWTRAWVRLKVANATATRQPVGV